MLVLGLPEIGVSSLLSVAAMQAEARLHFWRHAEASASAAAIAIEQGVSFFDADKRKRNKDRLSFYRIEHLDE